MNAVTIQAIEARQKFGELLERVYYQDKVYQITRKDKPMGWLVGDAFMEKMGIIINYIIENEPVIADTLAVMLDDEIRSVIEEGRKESARESEYPWKGARLVSSMTYNFIPRQPVSEHCGNFIQR